MDIETLVADHTRDCRKHRDYAQQYIKHRDELVEKAHVLSNELAQVQKQMAILRESEKSANARTAAQARADMDAQRERRSGIQKQLDDIAAEMIDMKKKAELVIQNNFDLSFALPPPTQSGRPQAVPAAPPLDMGRPGSNNGRLPPSGRRPIGHETMDIRDLYDEPYEERQGPPLTGNFTPRQVALTKRGRPVIRYNETELLAAVAAQQRDRPEFVQPPAKLIPEWFSVLESMELIPLHAATQEKRFDELLNKIWFYQQEIRLAQPSSAKISDDAVDDDDDDNVAYQDTTNKKPWNKNYHDAHPGWPTEAARKRGGWWLCRSDPATATAAELACRQCKQGNNAGPSSQANGPGASPDGIKAPFRPALDESRAHYTKIMDHIDRCMAIVGVRDRAIALAELRGARTDAEVLLSSENWRARAGFLGPDVPGKTCYRQPGGDDAVDSSAAQSKPDLEALWNKNSHIQPCVDAAKAESSAGGLPTAADSLPVNKPAVEAKDEGAKAAEARHGYSSAPSPSRLVAGIGGMTLGNDL